MKEYYYLIIDLLRQMWRFRWWGVLTMWLVGLFGAAVVMLLPNVYEANARFYVDASSRLSDVVRQLGMTPSVNSRVFLVRQAMLGRPQLERVASETGLDAGVTNAEERDDLMNAMQENVELVTGRGSEGQNLFTITYKHTNRDQAIAVVKKLLDGFIEHVLDTKTLDTNRAAKFLEDQLNHYRNLLSETEYALEEFKRENPGFVVQDGGGTFEKLQEARENVLALERRFVIERDKRDELRRQLRRVDPYAVANNSEAGDISSLVPGAATQARISQMEAERARLLLSYTPEHPDIIAIDQQLVRLEGLLESELETEQSRRGPDGASRATNPVYIEIQVSLSKINLQLAELEAELKNAREQVRDLDLALTSAPEIEREYIELTRNYDKWRGLYDEVLLQMERERIGRVGDQQDVVTFNVINPPQADLDPVSPPRVFLLIAAFLMALGAAAGVTFLLDQFNPTFGNETAMAKLQTPVLGSVSLFVSPALRSRRRADLSKFLAVVFAFVLVFGLIFLGKDYGLLLIAQARTG